MRSLFVLAAMASLAIAVPTTLDPIELDFVEGGANSTLEARDEPAWPGFFQCKQRSFKKPCQWTATGGAGALDCHKMIYSKGATDPDTSFGPDKGVVCLVYGGSNCESTTPNLLVKYPGGNLLDLGRGRGLFPEGSVEGFFSYRCRSWKQKDNDKEQSQYILLPKAP